jgi:hypothetical protein
MQFGIIKERKNPPDRRVVFTPEELERLIQNASIKPKRAIDLLEGIEMQRHAFVFRSLVWLLKLGVLSITTPSQEHS